MSSQRATAFVPGHVTAFFSAHRDDDPAVAGSRGAGVTLTDGVTVRVSAADDGDTVADDAAAGETTIDGEVGSIGAVDDVLAELDSAYELLETARLDRFHADHLGIVARPK